MQATLINNFKFLGTVGLIGIYMALGILFSELNQIIKGKANSFLTFDLFDAIDLTNKSIWTLIIIYITLFFIFIFYSFYTKTERSLIFLGFLAFLLVFTMVLGIIPTNIISLFLEMNFSLAYPGAKIKILLTSGISEILLIKMKCIIASISVIFYIGLLITIGAIDTLKEVIRSDKVRSDQEERIVPRGLSLISFLAAGISISIVLNNATSLLEGTLYLGLIYTGCLLLAYSISWIKKHHEKPFY